MIDLINTPKIRHITIVTSLIFTFVVMVYYGLGLNAVALPGNLYVNHSMNGIGKVVASIVWTVISGYHGRRKLLVTSLFLLSGCCCFSVFFQRLGEAYENIYSDGMLPI